MAKPDQKDQGGKPVVLYQEPDGTYIAVLIEQPTKTSVEPKPIEKKGERTNLW